MTRKTLPPPNNRPCVILSNRKRVIIALVHTVAFLLLAVYTGMLLVRPLHAGSPASGWIIAGVYVAVTTALLVLAAISGNAVERIYFGFCTTAAGFGLARQILGDAGIPAAVYVRVAMLACAVVIGAAMLRGYSRAAAAGKTSPAD
ncbi:MAG: hypothetical protein WB579_03050 [Bryobacteraceae bacterium]